MSEFPNNDRDPWAHGQERETGRLILDVVMQTQRGPEVHSFDSDATLVRTFSEDWQHMNYIAHKEDEGIRFVLGFNSLAEYLISMGFQESYADVPNRFDHEIYLEYGRQRMEREL